jgi:tetratricopeptide (TPR) repeat protein
MRKAAAAARAVLSCLLLLTAASIRAQEPPPTTVTVKLVVDRAVPDLVGWRYQANRFFDSALRVFKTQFGIRLAIGDPIRWQPENEKKSMADALVELRTKVQPEDCNIVLGVIDPGRIKTPSLGIASYPHGLILLCNVNSPEAMRYAFLHELCHIFGAIDLKEKGSVMGVLTPGLAIDGFTGSAVLLHRDRSFDRRSFPLAKDKIDDAISLYRQRADLGFGEPQTKLFLTLLYLEINDIESAARACGEAADADPGLIGLHVLLGNVCLIRGQTKQAIAEYTTALQLQPREAGIHFNLGLAYIQERLFKDAADECRAAIELNPNYVRARVTLARLLLAAGNAEAAALECRAALKGDPRSAEALCVLGTALVSLWRPFLPIPGAPQDTGRDSGNVIPPGSPSAWQAVLEAIPLLQNSIALDPNDPEAHVSLGSAYVAQGRYVEAEAEFLRALAIKPDDQDAHFCLGSLYFEMGDVRNAALHLERIMEADPGSGLGFRIIAQAYQIQKTYTLVARNPEK